MAINQRKAIFIDKDGTLIKNVPNNIELAKVELEDCVVEGLTLLKKAGYIFIVITNQSGLAKGLFTEDQLFKVFNKINYLLNQHNLHITDFFYCPHFPDGKIPHLSKTCNCRKPKSGLLNQAMNKHRIASNLSWMVGDILDDVEAGKKAGCKTVLIDNGNETEWISNSLRDPDILAGNLLTAAKLISKEDLIWQMRTFI